jgi:hypothetical protein
MCLHPPTRSLNLEREAERMYRGLGKVLAGHVTSCVAECSLVAGPVRREKN